MLKDQILCAENQFVEDGSGLLTSKLSILGLKIGEFPSEVFLADIYFYTGMKYDATETQVDGIWYTSRSGKKLFILNK